MLADGFTEEALRQLAEQALGHIAYLITGLIICAFFGALFHKLVQAPIWYWQTGIRKGQVVYLARRKARVDHPGWLACVFYMYDSESDVPIPGERLHTIHIEIPKQAPPSEVLCLKTEAEVKPIQVEIVKGKEDD